ncbi:MAG: glycerophosphodiester phosphodiesterase [Lachnospiraceae bacterium]|nr:glycerophosphodiester phosphodiesterase [Lachnospiraceae bacterium]
MLFRIFLIFLFTEGGGRIIDGLLNFMGYSYVTRNNYVSFLKHPSVILGLAFALILILFLILFEISGIFLLIDAGRNDKEVSLADIIALSWHHSTDFIKRYPMDWIFYMILCLPNLYLHILVWEVGRARLIDIVAEDICNIIGIPTFVIALAAYMVLAIIFSLGIPFRLFGKGEPFGPGPIAFSIKKGKKIRHVLESLFLHLRVFIAAASVFLPAVGICVLMIRTFRPVNHYVSDAMFYGSILKLLLGIIIGFLGTVTITGYLYNVYSENEDSCIDWTAVKHVRKPKTMIFLVILITGVILSYEGTRFIPNTIDTQEYLEISAHRGGAKFAPENTLAAIQYSIDVKSDYAEIDVQETADGEIVLMHDNWLGRTTGERKYIWDVSLEEVQKLDAGSSFSKKFKGERIPTLAEVLEVCRGKMRLNIEIKSNGHNADIVEKVLEIIHEAKFESNCVVTSMDYKILKEIKELSPEVITGYTLPMVYGKMNDLEAADFFSIKHTYISEYVVKRAHEMGKQVCAWTTNSRKDIRKVIDCGVDNVITDNPELVRKELMGEYDTIPKFLSLVKYAIQ